MSNNNHNQLNANVSVLQMYVDARDNYSETELKKQSECLRAAAV